MGDEEPAEKQRENTHIPGPRQAGPRVRPGGNASRDGGFYKVRLLWTEHIKTPDVHIQGPRTETSLVLLTPYFLGGGLKRCPIQTLWLSLHQIPETGGERLANSPGARLGTLPSALCLQMSPAQPGRARS